LNLALEFLQNKFFDSVEKKDHRQFAVHLVNALDPIPVIEEILTYYEFFCLEQNIQPLGYKEHPKSNKKKSRISQIFRSLGRKK